jgi:probable HAF family extracellular repeat protein
MIMFRRLRNFWILCAATIVLGCCSNAFAQVRYEVTDLGTLHDRNLACAMSLNDRGWTEIMNGELDPLSNSTAAPLVSGRALIDVDGLKIDLGTLGGKNSWMMWGQINDRGEIVGFSETSVPDPNDEDFCGFGTHLTCRPFIWRNGDMSSLPTVGGNNGSASGINMHGQIAGYAQTTVTDSGCPPYQTTRGVLWDKGKAQALPPVGSDPDSVAYGINNRGQVVGYSGTCTAANHAVLWENGTVVSLHDLGKGAIAFFINDRGEIAGEVGSANGETAYGALWKDGKITNLGTLPGDAAALATGINNHGQIVGSTIDSSNDWSHGFIWENGVMKDLNTMFPADSNLYITMANEINDRGQISGMATVLSGPHQGEIHAVLATPVNECAGPSIADVAGALPKITLPANVGKQILRGVGPERVER